VPSVAREEDPADIISILELRAAQQMKRLIEMDDGPDPSLAQIAFWNEILEAMADESADGQGIIVGARRVRSLRP